MSQIAPGLYIVGAGPGDPELLTLRAWRLLAGAEVVFYTDSLIPEAIAALINPEADRIPTASLDLEAILDQMIERVRAGQIVVRLHDGDPSLYSTLHEQMQGLLAVGIRPEVVPGVSAFQLAAARLQCELTVPERVQTVILTRQGGRTMVPEAEELAGLAAHRATLCLYLSAKTVAIAQEQLLVHYPAETPVAIAYHLGWPDEKIWVVPLGEMAATSQREGLRRTVLYMVSPALAGVDAIDSRESRCAPPSRLYASDYSRLFKA